MQLLQYDKVKIDDDVINEHKIKPPYPPLFIMIPYLGFVALHFCVFLCKHSRGTTIAQDDIHGHFLVIVIMYVGTKKHNPPRLHLFFLYLWLFIIVMVFWQIAITINKSNVVLLLLSLFFCVHAFKRSNISFFATCGHCHHVPIGEHHKTPPPFFLLPTFVFFHDHLSSWWFLVDCCHKTPSPSPPLLLCCSPSLCFLMHEC